MGQLRIWYPRVGSTMDAAAALAASGAPHGTVVQAAFQTAGRGRMGRAWETEPGGALLSSWILRGPLRQGGVAVLSPLIALAVIRAVRVLAPGAPVGYKWPNDVLIEDRKLAGILLTSRVHRDAVVVVAGIGVNVAAGGNQLTDRAFLAEWAATVAVHQVRNALATQLDRVWATYLAHGELGEPDRRELERCMVWRNEPVRVVAADGEVTGRIAGLEADGALRFCLEGDAGEVALRIGEIVRGPRRIAEKPTERYRILP